MFCLPTLSVSDCLSITDLAGVSRTREMTLGKSRAAALLRRYVTSQRSHTSTSVLLSLPPHTSSSFNNLHDSAHSTTARSYWQLSLRGLQHARLAVPAACLALRGPEALQPLSKEALFSLANMQSEVSEVLCP